MMKYIDNKRVYMNYGFSLFGGRGWYVSIHWYDRIGRGFHTNKFTAYREALKDVSLIK